MSAHPLYVLKLGARVHGLVAVSDSNWIDIFACVKPRNLDIQFSFVVNVKPNCAWLPLAGDDDDEDKHEGERVVGLCRILR